MDTSSPKLEIVTQRPLNASTPLPALLEPATPAGLVYVRNHFERPDLDPGEWRLEIRGAVLEPLSLPLDQIMSLPAVTQRVTFECAGNGRTNMNPVPGGTPWGLGAVSTVEWTGTPLAAVLAQAGVEADVVEIGFTGADSGEVEPGRVVPYARSLTLDRARDPDVLLVWAMNGAPLPQDHGYPLRLSVPGWYGMASVKWLTEVRALKTPFTGFFQREQYVYREEAGTAEAEPVREMRVRALIVQPEAFTEIPAGRVDMRGVAWSGHGSVAEVQVSADGGASWVPAELDPLSSKYTLQGWRAEIELYTPGEHTLVARATDTAGNRQPMKSRWNRLGYGNNGVHQVPLTIRSTQKKS